MENMEKPVICQQPDNKTPGMDSVDSGFFVEGEEDIKKSVDTKPPTEKEEAPMGTDAGAGTSSTSSDCCYYGNCDCTGCGGTPGSSNCDCDCGNCDCNLDGCEVIFYILCCPCLCLEGC